MRTFATSGQLAETPKIAHASFGTQLRAVAARGLYPATELVNRVDGSGEVLYRECLARVQAEEEIPSPIAFLPQLESEGLMVRFDVMVLQRAMAFLFCEPSLTLGCNVSRRNVRNEAAWAPVLEALTAGEQIAERLVIEVTEYEPVDPESVCVFVMRLQRLRCRVAVNDFGVRYGRRTHYPVIQTRTGLMRPLLS